MHRVSVVADGANGRGSCAEGRPCFQFSSPLSIAGVPA